MMKTVFKYDLDSEIEMPEGAEILSLQCQRDKPCIWALVNPSEKMVKRYFLIQGTGHPVPQDGELLKEKFVGTILVQHGSLVFHVWEVKVENK
jgi:hypothetical protein